MKRHLYLLFEATCLLLSTLGWSQATVSYPFAVGNAAGSGQIHFYHYNSASKNISSNTSTTSSEPRGRYTPQLTRGTPSAQKFSISSASVTYNPKDHHIYYALMSSGRTDVWRWPVGSKPTGNNPRLDTLHSFPFYAFMVFDAQGKGYFLEFGGTKAPYSAILRSVDFNTGVVGGRDTLQLTGGATIYSTGTGDITMTPSGQMLFVVDNKLFTADYKSYSGTGKKLTSTYVDTVRAGANMVGLTYAGGEIIAAYSGGTFAVINPLTAASSSITKANTVYTSNDLATVVSGIGVAKKLVSVTPTAIPKQYDVVYEIVVKNYGTYDLSNVQVTDDLTAINGAANVSNVTTSFVSNPAGLVLNPSFNGNSDRNLLNGTGTLPNYPVDNNNAVIRVSCRLSNINDGTLYYNSATASGVGFSGDVVTDISTNGSLPDLNNNDKPDDVGEDQPTPLLISITAQTPPCASLSTVLYKQDFGSGATIASLPSSPSGTTQYTGSASQPLTIDQYMVTQNTNNADNSRFISLADHTGSVNGRMMVVNADASSKVLYSGTVSGLCASQQYSLLFYSVFVGNPAYQTVCDGFGGFRYPRIRMRIRDAVSLAVITEIATVDITSSSWGQYGMKWVMPAGFSSVVFELINDGQGGCGNDLAIDDIQVGLCDPIPTVTLANTSAGCIGSTTNLTATLNDAGVIPGTKDYQWQISSDGTSWSNISGATSQNYSIATLTNGDINKYYRILVAAQGNINSTSCRYVSPAYLLESKTTSQPPTGVSASANNICPGETVTLSVQGGSLGTGAVWRWYSSNCSGTLIGTGATIDVTPSVTTTYFARAEGDCNTTACAQATVTINCTVLDCRYIDFMARAITPNKVKLNWSLFCDQETNAFIVERKDVSGFIPVYKMKGVSELNRNLTYEAIDHLAGIKANEVYYRLKSINLDGRVDYSNIKKVRLIKSEDRVLVIGNPVRNELKVQVEIGSGSKGQFELVDGNGRIMKKLVCSVVDGRNLINLDVSDLPSGVYYFKAYMEDERFTRKVYILK